MWCTARALTLATRGLPLAAARSAAAATHAQRLQPPCRAAASAADGGSGGGSGRQIAPPDVRELARMAHIAVTDEEVGQAGCGLAQPQAGNHESCDAWPRRRLRHSAACLDTCRPLAFTTLAGGGLGPQD